MGSGESDATAASNNSINNLKNNFINGIMTAFGLSQTNTITDNKTVKPSSNSKQPQHIHGKKSQTDLEKPVQPNMQKDEDDSELLDKEEEEEDWMFRTFDKVKAGNVSKNNSNKSNKNNNNVMQSRRLESNRDFGIEDAFEDPFEMAPEMQKQFIKNTKPQDLDPFAGIDNVDDDKSCFGFNSLGMGNNKVNVNNNCQDNNSNKNNNNICSFIDQIDSFVESGFL